MRKIIITICLASLSLLVSGQERDFTTSRSYVSERVYLDETGTKYADNVTYLDGFGRPLQEIQVNASPGGTADLVVPHAYGAQGRKEKEFLPFARTGNNGALVTNAYAAANWNAYGTADAAYAFTRMEYDGSPLNRVVKTTGAGNAWHTHGKGVTTAYALNAADEVRLYKVDLFSGALSLSGSYRAGSLEKVTTTDEDGHQVETFTDNAEKTVLTVTLDSDKRLETYYVYDDREQLRWVLSPEASYQLGTTVDVSTLNRLAYYYNYDRLGRMTEKRLPGCEPIYMVYDKRDRMVLSQDGNQRTADGNKWSYSVYDNDNRIIESGEMVLSSAMSHSQLQEAAWNAENYQPAGVKTPLQYTVYGSYEPTAQVTPHAFAQVEGYVTDYHELVTGLPTATKTRILGTDTWLTSTTYYDDKCRPIQTLSNNQHGTLSTVSTVYDFVGNVLKERETHGTDALETVNTYDGRNRLLTATYTLNGGTPATVSYEYDEVGRLVTKHYGEQVTEQMAYNIRGWLTTKESDAFKMELHYETPQAGATACYNGNISEWAWQQGTHANQLYAFTYDDVNRLKETAHFQKDGSNWVTNTNGYVEKGLTYDRNGNILTLQRTGNGEVISNLQQHYAGNQLSDCAYDANGNKTSADNQLYTYNLLGLQDKVYKVSGNELQAQYRYLANGVKLSVRDGSGNHGYDYDGKFIYSVKNGALSLDLVTFADGQFTAEGVRYALTDHLRNIRALVNGNGAILEQNDYYPFGGAYAQQGYLHAGNRHLLSGKEKQLLIDAGIYDFGFRMYNSYAGSWNAMDRLCEKYYATTPYMYANNNPLRFIDLWGLDTVPVVDGELYGGELGEVVVTAPRNSRGYYYLPSFSNGGSYNREDVSRWINSLDWTFSIVNEGKETKWFKDYTQKMYRTYNQTTGQIEGKYVWVKKTANTVVKPAKMVWKNSKVLGNVVSALSILDTTHSFKENPNFETGLELGKTAVGVVSFWGGVCITLYSLMWNAIKEDVKYMYIQSEQFLKDLTTFKINLIGF